MIFGVKYYSRIQRGEHFRKISVHHRTENPTLFVWKPQKSSFQWCHSFLDLSNLKKLYLQHMWFDHTTFIYIWMIKILDFLRAPSIKQSPPLKSAPLKPQFLLGRLFKQIRYRNIEGCTWPDIDKKKSLFQTYTTVHQLHSRKSPKHNWTRSLEDLARSHS